MSRFIRAALIAAATATVSPALAADDPSLLTVGAGLWDTNFNYDDQALEVRLEYRHGAGLFETDSFRGLKPTIGVMGNSLGGKFAYAGFSVPFFLDDAQRWEFTPSGAVGAYSRGNGLELGGVFEFHLGLMLNYAVTDGSRVGLYITHISNAYINGYNPGENSALLTWSFAL
ncbi:MAG: acyloxyacyl hydrolase [Rhodospirillaceae bacterium]